MMTQQQYQEQAISVNAAAKKYGIPQRTLADWARRGLVKVLVYPERRGQKMLVDEASVVLAREAYIPHWRKGQGKQFSMPIQTDPPPEVSDNPGSGDEGPATATVATAPAEVAVYRGTDPADYPQIETAPLIDKFHHFNRRLAQSTREGYYYRLKDFLDHFPILPLLPEPIQDYLDDMEGSDAHRHTCATLLRTLYRWAYRFRHIPREIESPIDLVKFPPDGRKSKLPMTLTDDEAMNVINAGQDFEERTLLRLLYTSGIRAGELRSLTEDMVYPPDSGIPVPSIRPDGKEGERQVWITDQLYNDLMALAASKRSKYIFPDRNGNQLGKSGLYHRVQKCMKKAGIKGKKQGPYRFRHTFVTDVLTDSGDLALAQKLAGHSKISTTERYSHLAARHIADGFARFNPEHRLNGASEEPEGEQQNES